MREIAAIPTVSDSSPDDPAWYPLQHALGIDTFGANLFVATHADQTLVEEHDERKSGQQELYLVLRERSPSSWTARKFESVDVQQSRSPIPLFAAVRQP